jgi:hypothetical protein
LLKAEKKSNLGLNEPHPRAGNLLRFKNEEIPKSKKSDQSLIID